MFGDVQGYPLTGHPAIIRGYPGSLDRQSGMIPEGRKVPRLALEVL